MTKEKYDIPSGSPAERIVEVASDLFYTQGYRATGINEVIAKSGVAKATFYSHFKTKDDLCKEYLKGSQHLMLQHMEKHIRNAKTPLEKLLAPARSLESMVAKEGFRGCAFLNIAAEVPDCQSPLRKQGIQVYDAVCCRIESLVEEVIGSDPDTFAWLNPQQIAKDYAMVLAGALALSELYGAHWPMQRCEGTIKEILGIAS